MAQRAIVLIANIDIGDAPPTYETIINNLAPLVNTAEREYGIYLYRPVGSELGVVLRGGGNTPEGCEIKEEDGD